MVPGYSRPFKATQKKKKSRSQLVSQLTMHTTCKEVGKILLYYWQASVSTKKSLKYTTFSEKKPHGYLLNFCLWLFNLASLQNILVAHFDKAEQYIPLSILFWTSPLQKKKILILLSFTQLEVKDHELLHVYLIFIFLKRIPQSYIKMMNCCK